MDIKQVFKDAQKIVDIMNGYNSSADIQVLNAAMKMIRSNTTKKLAKPKKVAKKSAKKVAKKSAKKAAAPRVRRGEWPEKVATVIRELGGAATAKGIISALGYEADKAKSGQVRTVLSAMKRAGAVTSNDDGVWFIRVPTNGAAASA